MGRRRSAQYGLPFPYCPTSLNQKRIEELFNEKRVSSERQVLRKHRDAAPLYVIGRSIFVDVLQVIENHFSMTDTSKGINLLSGQVLLEIRFMPAGAFLVKLLIYLEPSLGAHKSLAVSTAVNLTS